ncbi:hypothetical protein [Streptomyces albogriseolus]
MPSRRGAPLQQFPGADHTDQQVFEQFVPDVPVHRALAFLEGQQHRDDARRVPQQCRGAGGQGRTGLDVQGAQVVTAGEDRHGPDAVLEEDGGGIQQDTGGLLGAGELLAAPGQITGHGDRRTLRAAQQHRRPQSDVALLHQQLRGTAVEHQGEQRPLGLGEPACVGQVRLGARQPVPQRRHLRERLVQVHGP